MTTCSCVCPFYIFLLHFRRGCISSFVWTWGDDDTALNLWSYPPLLPHQVPLVPLSVIFMCATPFPWSQRVKTLSCDDIWMPENSFSHALTVRIYYLCVRVLTGLCGFSCPRSVSHTLWIRTFQLPVFKLCELVLFYIVHINPGKATCVLCCSVQTEQAFCRFLEKYFKFMVNFYT